MCLVVSDFKACPLATLAEKVRMSVSPSMLHHPERGSLKPSLTINHHSSLFTHPGRKRSPTSQWWWGCGWWWKWQRQVDLSEIFLEPSFSLLLLGTDLKVAPSAVPALLPGCGGCERAGV